MNFNTIIVLFIGTLAMMVPMFVQARKYGIKMWKIVPISFVLTVIGTLGTYLWYFVENLSFGGRSFYGAVFLVPIVFLAFARIMRMPYGQIMDLCAPAECVMLSLMKAKCLMDGCCEGRVLYMTELGELVRFPSQLAELVAAYLLVWILLVMSYKTGFRDKIFPWYMILYGASRFVLNFFREEWARYDGGMVPFGNVWSIVAIAIGVVWIVIYNKRHKAEKQEPINA